MLKIFGITLLSLSLAGFARADGPASVPEIDPSSAMMALTTFAGALLVIRSRSKK